MPQKVKQFHATKKRKITIKMIITYFTMARAKSDADLTMFKVINATDDFILVLQEALYIRIIYKFKNSLSLCTCATESLFFNNGLESNACLQRGFGQPQQAWIIPLQYQIRFSSPNLILNHVFTKTNQEQNLHCTCNNTNMK